MKTLFIALMLTATTWPTSAMSQTDSLQSFLYDSEGKLHYDAEYKINPDSDLVIWTQVEQRILDHLEKSVVYPKEYLSFGLMGMTITDMTVEAGVLLSINIHKSIGTGFDESLEKAINEIPSDLIYELSNGSNEKIVITLPVLFYIGKSDEKHVVVIQGGN